MAGKQSKKAKRDAADPAASSTPAATASTSAPTEVPKVASFDSELDAFFSSAKPAPPAVSANTVSAASSPPKPASAEAGPSNPRKRKQPQQQGSRTKAPVHDEKAGNDDDEELGGEEGDLSEASDIVFSDSDLNESDDDDAEDQPVTSRPPVADDYVPPVHESQKPGATDASKSTKSKNKFRETNEPNQLKDQRTLFLGNLPIEVVTSRPLRKKLVRFIESFSPYRAVTLASNLRFRSIPFSVPTSKLDDDEEEKEERSAAKKAKRMERSQNYKEALAAVEGDGKSAKPLTTSQKRKIAFINQDINEKASSVTAYLTIAHPQAVLHHLYATAPRSKQQKEGKSLDSSDDAEKKPANDRLELDNRLTGPVLAALIAAFADGQSFEGRHLRVDLVTPLSPGELLTSGLDKTKTVDGNMVGGSSSSSDTKQTLFVGGLDFEANEEEVRGFFEALVRAERGDPESVPIAIVGLDGKAPSPTLLQAFRDHLPWRNEDKLGYNETIIRPGEWVRSVRVVRDKATQMGKGFAYVKFADQQCVDEVLAIHQAEEAFLQTAKQGQGKGLQGSLAASAAIAAGGKEFKRRLKLRGRPIRVSRCKAQTKSSRPSNSNAGGRQRHEPSTPQRKYERSTGAPTPNGTSPHALRGNTSSGATKIFPRTPASPSQDAAKKAELYATLGKDERNQMKKQDEERVLRRLAKKKNKPGLADSKAGKHKSLLIEADKAKRKEKVKLKQPTANHSAKSKSARPNKSGPGGSNKSAKPKPKPKPAASK
ncbi:hypothetical protein BCV70DRAFT_201276 [Testicularia cyperi]|uniref:RRM domain-containing protein n=1 Tax=Testicularia cyperi TaxID=1882483 RepID=A0A317XLV5_9BASI|nr:hypothetical protein BCV70DRAFT_201276 [Testicularia cyperi]